MLLKIHNNSTNYKMYILLFIISFFLFSPKIYSISLTTCNTLSSSGETYILQNDINKPGGTCINITANNITLDCNNHKIIKIQILV